MILNTSMLGFPDSWGGLSGMRGGSAVVSKGLESMSVAHLRMLWCGGGRDTARRTTDSDEFVSLCLGVLIFSWTKRGQWDPGI